MEPPRIVVVGREDDAAALAMMAEEVRSGLLATPREIPSKYFYDDRGGALFDRITRLPEYYLTRAEEALLERFAPDIARHSDAVELVELGPGYGRKTRLLLRAMRERHRAIRYVPVDVSAAAIRSAGEHLVRELPDLRVHGVVGDFAGNLDRIPPGEGPRLFTFLGSTIGNFLGPDAVSLLAHVAAWMGTSDSFLLGTDLVKDAGRIHAAYNDAEGVTAEFNRNILEVVNRRLGGDFDPAKFDHVAFYDAGLERVEMHLQSREAQVVRLRDLSLTLGIAEREKIRTEVSCKYTRGRVERMLALSGLTMERWLTDEDAAFALSFSRRSGA